MADGKTYLLDETNFQNYAFPNGTATVTDANDLPDGVWACGSTVANLPMEAPCVVYQKSYAEGYTVQECTILLFGTTYKRVNYGGWSEWKKVYDENNPPTVVSLNSITPFTVDNAEEGSTQSFINFSMGGAVNGGIGFYGLTPYIMDDEGNLLGKIYHAGDKPTADEIGALPNNDASGVRKAINYIGRNPITTPEEDTVANWVALGTGCAYFNESGRLENQPSTYGFVENIVGYGLCYQVWHSMTTSGLMYHRAGSTNGWYGTGEWVKIYDTKNLTNGTSALTAGTSALATGNIYLQYE